MEKKVFKLGDVINVFIGMPLFERKLDGMFELCSYLTEARLTRERELRVVSRACADHIVASLPCFDTDEMSNALCALHRGLKERNGSQLFLTLWLAEREVVCGEFCKLAPIPNQR